MTLTILSLEDEAEVRQALERDLEEFDGRVRLELAEDASDAWSVVEEIESDGDELALVLSDHRLPGSLVSISLLSSLQIQGLVRLAQCWSRDRQIKVTPSRH